MFRDAHNEALRIQFQQLRQKEKDKGLSVEGLRLLCHMEKENRNAYGDYSFDARVIHVSDFDRFLQALMELKIPEGLELRLQAITCNGMHYTAFDFKLSADSNEAIVLDAAHDPRMVPATSKVMDLKDNNNNYFFSKVYTPSPPKEKPRDNMQQDYYSCPMFSFDHLCRVSEINDIYDQLKNCAIQRDIKGYENFPIVHWDMLPPTLVWNAQSYAWIEDYAREHSDDVDKIVPSLGISFTEYVQRGKTMINDGGHLDGIPFNQSTYLLFDRLRAPALEYLDAHANIPEVITHPNIEDEVARLVAIQSRVNEEGMHNKIDLLSKDAQRLIQNSSDNPTTGRGQVIIRLQEILKQLDNNDIVPLTNLLTCLKNIDTVSKTYWTSQTYTSKDRIKVDHAEKLNHAFETAYKDLASADDYYDKELLNTLLAKLNQSVFAAHDQIKLHHQEKHPVLAKLGLLKPSRLNTQGANNNNNAPPVKKSNN